MVVGAGRASTVTISQSNNSNFTADKSVATVEKLLKKWAKISEECFRPLVQSMQQVLKPVTFAYNPLS